MDKLTDFRSTEFGEVEIKESDIETIKCLKKLEHLLLQGVYESLQINQPRKAISERLKGILNWSKLKNEKNER